MFIALNYWVIFSSLEIFRTYIVEMTVAIKYPKAIVSNCLFLLRGNFLFIVITLTVLFHFLK